MASISQTELAKRLTKRFGGNDKFGAQKAAQIVDRFGDLDDRVDSLMIDSYLNQLNVGVIDRMAVTRPVGRMSSPAAESVGEGWARP